MDHEFRMGRLANIRNEQLSREYGHAEGKGHLNDQHHSLRGMMGLREEAREEGETLAQEKREVEHE